MLNDVGVFGGHGRNPGYRSTRVECRLDPVGEKAGVIRSTPSLPPLAVNSEKIGRA